MKYQTWITGDNNPLSPWGEGKTTEESLENAKSAYLSKYPEEENIASIEWDTTETK